MTMTVMMMMTFDGGVHTRTAAQHSPAPHHQSNSRLVSSLPLPFCRCRFAVLFCRSVVPL